MASYVTVSSDPVATGSDDLLCLVISDGTSWAVVGDNPTADDLRETLADDFTTSSDGAFSLQVACSGMSYYRIDGPHTFEGDTADVIEPLAKSYGLPA